jgi:hypothetical protein
VVNKVKQEELHLQQQTSETQSSVTGWAGVHIHMQFYQAGRMKDVILLDNQSTASIFCNKDLVENIYQVDEPMILKTNGGGLITNMKALVKDFGEAWFNPDSVTNIFSMAEMESKYTITYNPGEFIVNLPHLNATFSRNELGLYTFTPSQFGTSSNKDQGSFSAFGPLKVLKRINLCSLNVK